MSDYIERDKIGLTGFEIVMCNGDYKEALKMLFDKIESIPAADVRPVKHGKWEECGGVGGGWHFWRCTNCGAVDYKEFYFCPNCGAKMDGE